MRLYFLRHGIAQEYTAGVPDAQRALIPEGIQKIEQLAMRLTEWNIIPTIIYSSPLVRAHQTAAIIAAHTKAKMEIVESLGFDFDARAAQSLVDHHQQDDEIMFVGHEPSFSSTISYIIGGGNIDMKKGALARIDLNSTHPLYGSLVWLVSPKLI